MEQMQPSHGDDRGSEKQCEQQLARRKGHRAQHCAAQIDEGDLHRGNRRHHQKEGTVARKSLQHPHAIGARVEAIEHGREDKQRKKGSKQTQIVRRFAVERTHPRRAKKERKRPHRESGQHRDARHQSAR